MTYNQSHLVWLMRNAACRKAMFANAKGQLSDGALAHAQDRLAKALAAVHVPCVTAYHVDDYQ